MKLVQRLDLLDLLDLLAKPCGTGTTTRFHLFIIL